MINVSTDLLAQSKSNSPGDNLADLEVEGMDGVEANRVPFVTLEGHPQKTGIRPAVKRTEIKHVKDVSFVSQCLSAMSVPNVPIVVKELAVGAHFRIFG